MPHLTKAAFDRLEVTHGVASLRELIDCGVPLRTIKALVEAGTLESVLQGAYRVRGAPVDELARCAAVCVAHPEAVIAGPTAGRLHGFRRLPSDQRVHAISPPQSNPTVARWVAPYRTAAIHERDVVERRDGIRVTSRPRTALDLSRFVGRRDLRSIIEQAMCDGGHSLEEMRAVALDWISPRRRWLRTYLDVLDDRLPGGPAESDPETELGRALERAGVQGLVRQFEIDLVGYGRARFDMAVPNLRWAIEVDVFPTHRESAGQLADERRDAAAARLGWRTTRLGPDHFGSSLDETVAGLLQTYRALSDER
jgi:very-short-patch-repair endonuclease